MALSKESCWHHWPFDADLVMRKTGARRLGDPVTALAMVARLARELGYDARLYQRNARLTALTLPNGRPPNQDYVKEQAQYALGIGNHLFTMSSARSWAEELVVAHRRMATSTQAMDKRQQTSWMGPAEDIALPSVSRELMNRARPLVVARERWNPGTIGRSRLDRLLPARRSFPDGAVPYPVTPEIKSAEEFWATVSYHLRAKGVEATVNQLTSVAPIPFKWPTGQGNDTAQLVRRQYTMTLGKLLIHSDPDDNGDSLVVESAQNPSRLSVTTSMDVPPKHFGLPNAIEQILRQIHLQQLDANLPAVSEEAASRLKARM